MYQITAYLKFLWRSKNQHGVHSPFVYGLVTRCFYDSSKYPSYSIMHKYRKRLLKNSATISVTDLGAGSRVFRTPERKISQVARSVGISRKRAKLLNRLVRYLNVGRALELGTSLGLSTASIAAGNSVSILTIEGCPNTAEVARESFEHFHLNGIEQQIGAFEDLLQAVSKRKNDHQISQDYPSEENYDLVFFDGNHQKQSTLKYFYQLLPLAHNDSVFIFDDIHWSRGMTEAWEEIKAHPSVKVSIDTFQWGLVFFRREQEKQHFVIRV